MTSTATQQFVDAAGVRVHYLERGAPAAPGTPTALLLHGFPVDHRIMLTAFESAFATHPHWRRVYLDLPGLGATPAAWVASTDDMLTVLLAAVDALGLDRYTVIGESYGGYLSRGLVAAQPERIEGLGLLCPSIITDHSQRDVDPHRVLHRDRALEAELGPALLDTDTVGVVQTRETWRRFTEEVAPGLAAADPALSDRMDASGSPTFPIDVRQFDRPTLFLLGRQDSSTGYRDAYRILERYPRATFAVLDRAGHNLQYEQPALFDALVREWLDRVDEVREGRLTPP